MDIVLISHEKEAEIETFSTEDLVIGMFVSKVPQDTVFVQIVISLKDVYSESSSYGENSVCGCQAVGKDWHPYAPSYLYSTSPSDRTKLQSFPERLMNMVASALVLSWRLNSMSKSFMQEP